MTFNKKFKKFTINHSDFNTEFSANVAWLWKKKFDAMEPVKPSWRPQGVIVKILVEAQNVKSDIETYKSCLGFRKQWMWIKPDSVTLARKVMTTSCSQRNSESNVPRPGRLSSELTTRWSWTRQQESSGEMTESHSWRTFFGSNYCRNDFSCALHKSDNACEISFLLLIHVIRWRQWRQLMTSWRKRRSVLNGQLVTVLQLNLRVESPTVWRWFNAKTSWPLS